MAVSQFMCSNYILLLCECPFEWPCHVLRVAYHIVWASIVYLMMRKEEPVCRSRFAFRPAFSRASPRDRAAELPRSLPFPRLASPQKARRRGACSFAASAPVPSLTSLSLARTLRLLLDQSTVASLPSSARVNHSHPSDPPSPRNR